MARFISVSPRLETNRKIVITGTDQVAQHIIRNYETQSFCMAKSGLQEPWIKSDDIVFSSMDKYT